jgi:hypothetical protein
MSFKSKDDLIARIEARFEDPARRALAVDIAVDFADLAALALVNPTAAESRARHLKAQVAGMAATEISFIHLEVSSWITTIVSTLLRAAIA